MGMPEPLASQRALEDLRRIARRLDPGPVDEPLIEPLLAAAWDALEGGDREGMTGAWILGRAERLTWHLPELMFNVERYGAAVPGSTRVEVHGWSVNVETGRAVCDTNRGYRQQTQRARPARVEPLADAVANAVLNHQAHPALTWITPKRVRVALSHFDALSRGYKETITGRRKRFLEALSARVLVSGWRQVLSGGSVTYERIGSGTG